MINQIKLPLSNAYLLQGERPILVDTGAPGDSNRIIAALERSGVRLADLALLVHTHAHGDHVGSTADLLSHAPLPTALHAADLPLVRAGQAAVKFSRWTAQWLAPFVLKAWQPFEPTILLKDGDTLADYGVAARVVHTPGHTGGSISLLFANGDAIVGDVMMGGHLGGTFAPTKPRYHYFIDNRDTVHASIRRLLDLGVERFFVGHGGPLSRRDVQRVFSTQLLTAQPVTA
jgi:hydroxyacylglutathione hydrolase